MFHNPLIITKIINGIERILGIASQIVPIYQKVSPTISNAHSIIKKIPKININTNKVTNKEIKKKKNLKN
mgnify:CR=1 FL=1